MLHIHYLSVLSESLVRVVDVAILLLTNSVASYFDITRREIPDKVWIPAIISSVLTMYYVMTCAEISLKILYLTDVVLGVIMFILIFLFKFAGGADAKSILLVGLSLPPGGGEGNSLLIMLNLPVVAVVINSLVGVLAYAIYTYLRNRYAFSKCEQLYKLRGLERVLLRFSAICVPVGEVLRNSHKLSPILNRKELRLLMTIEDREGILEEIVARGILREDDYVLAVYYMPYIVCITIGLVLYLILNCSLFGLIAKYF